MITFRITTHSGVPAYMQIVQQVRRALQLGVLQVGDRLPTVKDVVTVTPINPNTVFKAYRELERDGLVRPRAGLGTFVVKRPAGPPPSTQTLLAEELADWVDRARTAGLDDISIEALMRVMLHERRGHETQDNN